jgi:hypothetical protein
MGPKCTIIIVGARNRQVKVVFRRGFELTAPCLVVDLLIVLTRIVFVQLYSSNVMPDPVEQSTKYPPCQVQSISKALFHSRSSMTEKRSETSSKHT